MSNKIIIYKTFYNTIEANIVLARLKDGEFPCFLADENISTLQPLYNQAIGGVKLMVFEKDKSTIDQVLAQENTLENSASTTDPDRTINESEILCDHCGSANVAFVQATQRRFSWWVTLISLVLFIYPFKANKCFHCYDCGHEFH